MSYLRQINIEDLSDPHYAVSDADADPSLWLHQDAVTTNETATTHSGGADWNLSNCCGRYETIFLSCTAAYLAIIAILWKTVLMKPMKLIAVFVHEMGHATACWMTGGKVQGIEVHGDEGGVTKYVGGWRLLIIPAGYIGGSFWGAVFVVFSGNRWGSLAVAIILCLAMIISMRYSPNKTMVLLNLAFLVLTIVFIVIEFSVTSPFLQFLTLFYGVFIGSFSMLDIYDDLITRTVEGSDAHACFKLIPCCLPRCVGVQFGLMALAFQGLGLYLALVWMSST